MVFFELLAAASLSLALAIPVFMDRVMRPRYEERFEEFRQHNRLSFFEAFERALEKFRRAKTSARLLTPEVYQTMEDLFVRWGRVKASENQLDALLRRRKYLFVAWMISFGMSVGASGFPDLIIIRPNIRIGDTALWTFILVAVYSVYYVVQLFELDEKVSRFKGVGPKPTEDMPVLSTTKAGPAVASELERDMAEQLRKANVEFELRPRMPDAGFIPDFVVPSSKNPKYFIEIKGNVNRRSTASWLNYESRGLKHRYPTARTVLIAHKIPHDIETLLDRGWDFVFDWTELTKIIATLKT